MRDALDRIINDSDTRLGRVFDISIQSLIVVSLVAFSLETLPELRERTRHWLRIFEIASIVIFTAEYVLRIAVARPRSRFVFSFFGLVDGLAILPFYLGLGVDLRSLRALRILRLFRVLKLARYSRAAARLRSAFVAVREELVLFGTTSLILLYISAVGIYHFENAAQPDKFRHVFDGLWWAVATLTTVGYGDVYPITFGGRVFTLFVLAVGLGIIAVPTGLIASALSSARCDEPECPIR